MTRKQYERECWKIAELNETEGVKLLLLNSLELDEDIVEEQTEFEKFVDKVGNYEAMEQISEFFKKNAEHSECPNVDLLIAKLVHPDTYYEDDGYEILGMLDEAKLEVW